jgi:hypothetical protein
LVVSAADLLARLEHVHTCASGRWRAVCPSHDSKHRTQSLSIRELGDGTLLVKCFAGCGAADVVAAIGLQLRDLFPKNHCAPSEPRHPQHPGHWHAVKQAVETLRFECLLCAIAAEDCACGKPLSPADAARVALAADRIRDALKACL